MRSKYILGFRCGLVWLGLALLTPACYSQPVHFHAYDRTTARLISFSASSPQTLVTQVPITGLDPGETLLGLDFRPGTGQLYALAGAAQRVRLLVVNAQTGKASQVGAAALTLDASFGYGVTFEDSATLRIVNTGGANLRISATDAMIIASGFALAYERGDPNFGITAFVAHAARSGDATAQAPRTLYGIDYDNDSLVRVGGVSGTPSADGGQITTLGSLGIVTANRYGGFDIHSETQTAYAALPVAGVTGLYTISLATGAASLVGVIGNGTSIDGLAIAPTPSQCLDVDGDGVVLAHTDGIMLLRALSGFTGQAVTEGAIASPLPPRSTWPVIQSYLNSNCGTNFGLIGGMPAPNPCLDVDGDGMVTPMTDGLILVRAALGLTGNAASSNALSTPLPPRPTWSAVQQHLNSSCGTTYSP